MGKLPDPVVNSSKNVAIRSNINIGRLRFHGLFDRCRRANPITGRPQGADTDPELEAENDRRDTSQHIQRISKGGKFHGCGH
jgi:hypothetical protein